MKLLLRHMAVPLVWAAIVLFLYGVPGNDVVFQDPWEILKFDKLAHMLLFAVQVITLTVGLRKQNYYRRPRAHALKSSVFIAFTYGALLEYFQGQLFESRHTDILDFLANSVGTLILGPLAFRMIYGKELARAC